MSTGGAGPFFQDSRVASRRAFLFLFLNLFVFLRRSRVTRGNKNKNTNKNKTLQRPSSSFFFAASRVLSWGNGSPMFRQVCRVRADGFRRAFAPPLVYKKPTLS